VTARENKTEGRVYTMPAPKSALRDYAKRSAQVLEGYGEGLVDPLVQTGKLVAEGLGNIATQPIETGKALVWGAGELGSMAIDGWRQIIADPGQAFDAFVWAGKEGLAKANEILAGDPKQAGKLVGQIVGGVVVPAGMAGKAAKAKGAAKAKPATTPELGKGPNSGAVVLKEKPPPDGYKTYKTHGIKDDPKTSPEGRRLAKEYEDLGLSQQDATIKARELMETGSTPPLANPVEAGDRFYKLVPEGNMPGPKSEYWVTREQLQSLEGLDRDQIASRLGLPLEQQKSARFDVVEIKAMRPSTTFVSKIAPTTQNGWSRTGGGIQSLITDRTAFTPPVSTGVKLP
jgi:hypothetical protein